MSTLKIEMLELPSDWLDQYREEKLARKRKAIRDKHRRKYLRQMKRRQTQKGE